MNTVLLSDIRADLPATGRPRAYWQQRPLFDPQFVALADGAEAQITTGAQALGFSKGEGPFSWRGSSQVLDYHGWRRCRGDE